MRRQRSVIILALLSVTLAELANPLGNVLADQLPAAFKANALPIFGIAILIEALASVILTRLETADRTLLRAATAYVFISLGVVFAALGGVASNFVAAALPDGIRPYVVPNVWLLLAAVTVFAIAVAVALYHLSGVLRLTPDNRKAFLSKVCERYTNRLRDTLGEAARIDLNLREDARAITQPALARQELGNGREEQSAERALASSTPISRVYDEANEELLILGEPGSGKTTLLVELALELVGRAEKSKSAKMPVIFSLASWAVKRQPLVEWMAEELYETYQVPRKVAAAWMEAEEMLPLLDGLDEVAEEHRAACLNAIEVYHREHERVPLVVCSRSMEYFALPTRLHLRTAVVVQPLTDAQIDAYLARGQGLAGLQDALTADPQLRSAAHIPLILGVMALAYQGMASEAIPRVGDEKAWRRSLFGAYVPRMYHRQRGRSELEARERYASRNRRRRPRGKAAEPLYTLDQTVHYLSWLAAQMKAQGQTDFYLERMQWDWVPEWVRPLPDEKGYRERSRIELAESLRFSWRLALQTIPWALILGAIMGLVGVVCGSANLLVDRLFPALSGGNSQSSEFYGTVMVVLLFVGVGVAMLLPVAASNTQMVDERDLERPGEGIQRSFRNGIIGAVVLGPIQGLALAVILTAAFEFVVQRRISIDAFWMEIAGIFGLCLALASAWGYWQSMGGDASGEYRSLLRVLAGADVAPAEYSQFLDFAAERVLLQRIGGGYRFIHALLLDYFADLWAESGGTGSPSTHADQIPSRVLE